MSRIYQRPCSLDDSYERIDIVPNTPPLPTVNINSDVPVSRRRQPLTETEFKKFFDNDGRLVDEHGLRKAVFLGGIDPAIRKVVWKFLFGLYPCTSTARERDAILLDYIVKYNELKARWKIMLVAAAPPGASPTEQGLMAKYQIPEGMNSPSSPDWRVTDPPFQNGCGSSASHSIHKSSSIDQALVAGTGLADEINSPEMKQKIEFIKLQAQVYVNWQKIDTNDLKSHIRVIDKDVPRTDRDIEYFRGKNNPHLTQLREILITLSAYNPKLGYAQGMNDILSRFLFVLDSEVETYWCFKHYMEKIEEDFSEDGMVKKIDLVRMLLGEVDPALLHHFEIYDLGNLYFCHRWLLLGFKREFTFEDSLRCFEILSSHHLELSSLEAEKALMKEERLEFQNSGGDTRTTHLPQKEYTFEVFMCAAILMEFRNDLFRCTDTGMVFTCVNSLKIELDSVLTKSERLFFTYCKKTVEDSFHMVEQTSCFGSQSSSLLSNR